MVLFVRPPRFLALVIVQVYNLLVQFTLTVQGAYLEKK